MVKYYIKTFGCQMNTSDSERIAGFLESSNLKLANKIDTANLVIFNTCGVRQMAEDRVYGQIHNLKKASPKVKIILTGCLADRKDVQRKLKEKVDLFCEIKDFQKEIVKLLNRHPERSEGSRDSCLPAGTASATPQNDICYLSIKPEYSNKTFAFIPVMTGCNNFCAYCVVPYARGREVSRSAKEIFSEVENLAKKKYKEITLLGQNVNSYQFINKNSSAGEAGKFDFPRLLDLLAQKFPQIKIRFLTSHPKDFSENLMKVIAENKNISKEIHLPIQSGSDKILKAMNRPYTRKHYLSLIKKAQKLIPGVSFTTDVIVGFPGETEKDFEDTVKIFKKVGFNEAYINKYSPRPGTAAFSLGDPISWGEKKNREKILREIIKKD